MSFSRFAFGAFLVCFWSGPLGMQAYHNESKVQCKVQRGQGRAVLRRAGQARGKAREKIATKLEQNYGKRPNSEIPKIWPMVLTFLKKSL